jgi:DinB family protein
MRPTERLLDQLNRAYGGEAWHGVTDHQAAAHPIHGAHSILELVVHAATWMDVVGQRIAGTAVESKDVEDWADVSKISWAEAIGRLERAQSRLCDAVARLSSEELEKPVAGAKRSKFSEIAGALQHTVYHSGQIALLKKSL